MVPVIELGSARFGLAFHEMTVLLMMAKKRSAKEIRARLAVGGYEPSPDFVLQVVHGIRTKLACGKSETLVECARRQGVIK